MKELTNRQIVSVVDKNRLIKDINEMIKNGFSELHMKFVLYGKYGELIGVSEIDKKIEEFVK